MLNGKAFLIIEKFCFICLGLIFYNCLGLIF